MMTKLKTTVLMSIVLFMASCSSNKVLTQADTLVGAYDKSTTITDEEFSRFSGKLVGIGVYFSKSVQKELFVHYSPE